MSVQMMETQPHSGPASALEGEITALRTANMLTREQVEQYDEQGFFVVPNVFDADEVRAMIDECESILRGDYGHLYLGAVQIDPGAPRELKAERKISDVVERSQTFRKYLLKKDLLLRVQDVIGPDLMLFRDILMLKPARVGSKMPWHQDSNYWPIEPTSLCSVWTALDAATIENGCMRVIPGSHKLELIPSRDATGRGPLEDDQVDLDAAIDVPMEPGSSLFFHSRLLHGSEPNNSENPRRAFITSFMSARSLRTEASGDNRRRYFLACGRNYPGCVQS